MQAKLRTIFFLAVLCLATGPGLASAQLAATADPAVVGMSADRLERLTETLQRFAEQEQTAGSVAMVLRRGQVVYREAFGMRDREAGDAMEADDIFRIASQTKAIVSTAIMMLQEDGKLLISDRLSQYIPEFAETQVAVAREGGGYDLVEGRPITLRHLLTHTAGIGWGSGVAREEWNAAGFQQWYFANNDEPILETVRRIGGLPLDGQPGDAFIYGLSIDVLGAVVEVVSGMPLDRFLQTRIFDPLGMDDTHFYLPLAKRDRLTAVYGPAQGGGLQRAADSGERVAQGAYVDGPRVSFSGGAGLLSTADDYAAFLQMMLNGGELNGHRLLSPTTVDLMTVNHVDDLLGSTSGFGLGFQVLRDVGARGTPGAIGEFGWGGAYHSSYWVDPLNELVVVYFTQMMPGPRIDDFGALRALIYQAIVER